MSKGIPKGVEEELRQAEDKRAAFVGKTRAHLAKQAGKIKAQKEEIASLRRSMTEFLDLDWSLVRKAVDELVTKLLLEQHKLVHESLDTSKKGGK